jgi:hypothetical protein
MIIDAIFNRMPHSGKGRQIAKVGAESNVGPLCPSAIMLGKRVPALDSQPEIGTLPLRRQKIREESLRGGNHESIARLQPNR